MAECSKSFTLEVIDVQPWLWWAMEESGTNNRIDKVKSLPLFLTFNVGVTVSNPTGKVNKGMQFLAPAGAGFDSFWEADPTPPAIYTGVQYVFWAKWTSWSDVPGKSFQWGLVWHTLFYDNGNGVQLIRLFYFQQNLQLSIDDLDSDILNVPFVPVAGTWYFFVVFHDPVTHTYGLQINQGTVHSAATTSAPVGSMDSLTLTPTVANETAILPTPQTQILWDEYGLFDHKLDAASNDFLYNSGAGRTFPFV